VKRTPPFLLPFLWGKCYNIYNYTHQENSALAAEVKRIVWKLTYSRRKDMASKLRFLREEPMKDKEKLSGQSGFVVRWPVWLSGLVLANSALLFFIDRTSALVLFLFGLLYLLVSLWLFYTRRSRLIHDIVNYAVAFNETQREFLDKLKIPYAVIDENGTFLWQNQAFQAISQKQKHLTELFPELRKRDFLEPDPEENTLVLAGESHYRLISEDIPVPEELRKNELFDMQDKNQLRGIYMIDETDRIRCEKMVACLIYLDNYEEALASVEEVRRSLLVALIDRKINRFFLNRDAVVRKTEKDKYFVVLKQKHVAELKEDKFSLLEDVKTVNIGNEMSVTLSIGLGMNGEEYNQNFEYARMAIDMALGRGGDQAVVKDGDRIQYFGGKTQQLEKNTRVKARVKAHALRELVENKERVVIMGHKLGDIDCFGAAIGLYRAMVSLGKKVHIVINDVTTSVKPLMDDFIESPEYPDDLFVQGEQAMSMMTDDTVLAIVDVNRVSITEQKELLDLAKTIVVLDHHRQMAESITDAVLSYVEPYASSTCELVAEILQYISDNVKLRSMEANALYAGIVLDTNNFTNQTGVRTFEAAAFLRRNGADVVKVRKMFRDSMEEYKAKAEAVRQAEVFEGSFAISICPPCGESPTIIGAQAANELLNIVGIKASIVLTEYNGTIYISARSIDEVNVQVIMERLGGGGHLSTAGAQLKGCSIEDARELVKETLKHMIEEGDL
jgi:c-di-AMP phosphodiesterase-like protein